MIKNQRKYCWAKQFTVAYIAGGGSNFLAKLLFTPYNNAKLMYIYQDSRIKSGTLDQAFQSIFDSARYIIKDRGFSGLWRNYGLFNSFTVSGFIFAFNHIYLQFIRANSSKVNTTLKAIDSFIAGSMAGITHKLVFFPFFFAIDSYLKDQRLARKQVKYSSIWDVYKKTIQFEGIRGFYRGFAIEAGGAAVYRSLYFGLYDWLKTYLKVQNWIAKFFLAWNIAAIADFMSFPVNNIRKRKNMGKFLTHYQAIKHIFLKDGARWFFYNTYLNPFITISSVSSRKTAGVTLVLYDWIKTHYDRTQYE